MRLGRSMSFHEDRRGHPPVEVALQASEIVSSDGGNAIKIGGPAVVTRGLQAKMSPFSQRAESQNTSSGGLQSNEREQDSEPFSEAM